MVEEQIKYKIRSVEEDIFLAAEHVFHERGYDGARMQEIADRAGINKAMLHYYFRSKDRLFHAVFTATLGRILPRVVEPLASDLPLGIKIRRFVETYIDQLERNPKMPGFIIHELNRHPERLREAALEHIAPVLPTIRGQIDEAVAQGLIKPLKAEDLIANLLSLCIFPFLARPVLQAVMTMDPDQYDQFLADRKQTVTDFVFNALRI
jgi:AcrR family transcriptional regulator